MPDSLSPVTMTEDYYAKIAGQDVTQPDPATREQKWLDAIAGRVDGLAEDVEDLGDIVPTPEAADSGKVLTAGADGTASWQTPSGGGSKPIVIIKNDYTDYELENVTLTDVQSHDVHCDIVVEDGGINAYMQGVLSYGSVFGVSNAYRLATFPVAGINTVSSTQYVYNNYSFAGILNTDGTIDADHFYFYEGSAVTLPLST